MFLIKWTYVNIHTFQHKRYLEFTVFCAGERQGNCTLLDAKEFALVSSWWVEGKKHVLPWLLIQRGDQKTVPGTASCVGSFLDCQSSSRHHSRRHAEVAISKTDTAILERETSHDYV